MNRFTPLRLSKIHDLIHKLSESEHRTDEQYAWLKLKLEKQMKKYLSENKIK